MKKFFFVCLLCGVTVFNLSAQDKNFTVGKWLQLNASALSALDAYYVDTLNFDDICKRGLEKMVAGIDPYTMFVAEEDDENFTMLILNTYGGIGSIIHKEKDRNLIIDEPYDGSPAALAGLQSCDEVMEIDGVSVIGLETKECTERMKGKPGTQVTLKVKKVHTGEIKNITITRRQIHLPGISCVTMLNDTTGYVCQNSFTQQGVAGEVRKAFETLKNMGMKRFILDLRGNGGGMLAEAVDVVSIFVPEGSLVVTNRGRGEADVEEFRTNLEPVDMEMDVVVLVDESSASASEIVAGALQDLDRATVMGEQTYGKGLVQNIIPLPFGAQIKITTARYHTPSGRCIQKYDYTTLGSRRAVADSLKKEFRTASGRVVRDAGGITPDIYIESQTYSRTTALLVYNGITQDFVFDYVRNHPQIAPVKDFHLTDEDWQRFIEIAYTKDFDCRPESFVTLEELKKEIEKDGYTSRASQQLKALEDVLNTTKAELLEIVRDEVTTYLEGEIVARYYYQEARYLKNLPSDVVLQKVIETKSLAL